MNTNYSTQRRGENKAWQSDAFFFGRVIKLRRIVREIVARMVGQPHGGCISFPNRKWTRRRRRRLSPVRNKIIILRSWLRSHFFNLFWPKSGVPNYRPFWSQTLQMDQAVPTVGAGFPAIIADLDFRSFRFDDAFGGGGQFLDLIDVAVIFPQLGESFFIPAPNPTIKKDDQQYANQHCQPARHRCLPGPCFPRTTSYTTVANATMKMTASNSMNV